MNRHNKYFYHLRDCYLIFGLDLSTVEVGITQTRENYRLIMDDIGADLKNTIANLRCLLGGSFEFVLITWTFGCW